MSWLFGSVVPEKTVLVVDIENGSVASALVRISEKKEPKLFGEHRVSLPIRNTVSSADITEMISRAINESLGYTSEVAARIRQNSEIAPLGIISHAHLFFTAPWTAPTLESGELQWSFDPFVLENIQRSTESIVGNVPIQRHPFGSAVAHTTHSIIEGPILACIVTGEIVELLLIENGRVTNRATVPVGLHTVLRTVRRHTGLSIPEAHSALRLYHMAPEGVPHIHEPLHSEGEQFVVQFIDATKNMARLHTAQNVIVIGREPVAEWFARTLSQHSQVAELFPNGGVTRTLRPKHVSPYVASDGAILDMPLLIEAMFVHAHEYSNN